jgi:hypothetical protein
MRELAYLWAAAVLGLGSGCAESLTHAPPSETLFMPDTPVWSTEPLPNVPTDHWDELAATYLAPPPRPIRRSISLGFIGDEPLGRFDPRPPVYAVPIPPQQAPNGCRCPSAPSCSAPPALPGARSWPPTSGVPSL